MVLTLKTRRDTRKLGYALAAVLKEGDLLLIDGDIGVGKTFLIRALARGMGVPTSIKVTSPTFGVMQELPGRTLEILHVDLYRIETIENFLSAEIREKMCGKAVVVVEWGGRLPAAIKSEGLRIRISHSPAEGRSVHFRPEGERGRSLLKLLEAELGR